MTVVDGMKANPDNVNCASDCVKPWVSTTRVDVKRSLENDCLRVVHGVTDTGSKETTISSGSLCADLTDPKKQRVLEVFEGRGEIVAARVNGEPPANSG